MEKNQIRKTEVLRFLVGGGSAVATDYIVYSLLLYWDANISISKAVSYICGAAVGFVINKIWTFGSKGFSKAELMKYILLYAVSACVNAGINKLVILLAAMRIVSFLCATFVSAVLNFLGQKFFVFIKKGDLG